MKSSGFIVAMSLAAIGFCASASQDDAPPVVWEIQSEIRQSGWGGLSNPNATRFRHVFSKPTVDDLGISSVVSTRGEWEITEEWSGGFATTAMVNGDFGPASLRAIAQLSSQWSSQFIIEEAVAGTTVRAWVRGLPGTIYQIATSHEGVWTGYLGDTGGMALYGLGERVDRPCANCSVNQSFSEYNPGAIAWSSVTVGTPRQFSEYPGVWYSEALFARDNGTATPDAMFVDAAGILHGAAESCILACGPRSEVVGGGVMVSEWNIAISRSIVPRVEFVVDPSEVTAKLGRDARFGALVEFVAASLADRGGPGRIIDYRWYVDGVLVDSGADASSIDFSPSRLGLHGIRVVAIDDFGAWSDASGTFEVQACLGDIDVDGDIDLSDVNMFTAAFVDGASEADLSGDGLFGLEDIVLFVASYLNGCDPA